MFDGKLANNSVKFCEMSSSRGIAQINCVTSIARESKVARTLDSARSLFRKITRVYISRINGASSAFMRSLPKEKRDSFDRIYINISPKCSDPWWRRRSWRRLREKPRGKRCRNVMWLNRKLNTFLTIVAVIFTRLQFPFSLLRHAKRATLVDRKLNTMRRRSRALEEEVLARRLRLIRVNSQQSYKVQGVNSI